MAREDPYRVAYSALKHTFDKKGDRRVKKDHKGPSDRAANPRGQGKPREVLRRR
jgi:hypothetical protein